MWWSHEDGLILNCLDLWFIRYVEAFFKSIDPHIQKKVVLIHETKIAVIDADDKAL